MKKILFLLCFLTLFQLSCATVDRCAETHVKKSPYSSKEVVESKLKTPSKEGVVRLLFEAPWCDACKRLDVLMGQAEVKDKVLRLNVDETWAFLTSRRLQVGSVPTLVEIRRGMPPVIITGPEKIVMRLLIK